MSFDFEKAEAWDVSTDTILGAGNHIAKIVMAEPSFTSNQNPQLELKVENAKGSLRDWIVITRGTDGRTPVGVRKIASLYDAAGIPRPSAGEINPETGEISPGCAARLIGRTVGVVARDEPHYKDPTKTQTRIQGYVDQSQINPQATNGSDIPVGAGVSIPDGQIPF